MPWTEDALDRLTLLIVMSLLAPIVAWASGLVKLRRSSEDEFVPRSVLLLLLAQLMQLVLAPVRMLVPVAVSLLDNFRER